MLHPKGHVLGTAVYSATLYGALMSSCAPSPIPVVTRSAHSVPATAPDSVPTGYYDAANLVRNSRFPSPFYRDVVSVLFYPAATVGQRQAAVDSVDGTVIGGVRLGDEDGFYLIRLPPDSLNNRPLDAAAKLTRLPGVQVAEPDWNLVFACHPGKPC